MFTLWADPDVATDITNFRPPINQETTDRYVRANGIDLAIRAH